MKKLAALVLTGAGLLLAGCVSTAAPASVGPTYSPAELSRLVQETLDDQWAYVSSNYPDAIRPVVPIVRYTTMQDQSETYVACLRDAGFDVALGGNGQGVVSEGLVSQAEAYDLAYYTCQAMYPLDPAFRVPLTKQEVEFIYDYLVGDLSDCLRDAGVEPATAPSFQSFLETYGTDSTWSPYEGITVESQERFDELNRSCPQYPPGFRE